MTPRRAADAAQVRACSSERQIGVQLSASGFAWYRGRQVTGRSTKIRCSVLALGSLFTRALPSHVKGHDRSLHHALQGLPHVN